MLSTSTIFVYRATLLIVGYARGYGARKRNPLMFTEVFLWALILSDTYGVTGHIHEYLTLTLTLRLTLEYYP